MLRLYHKCLWGVLVKGFGITRVGFLHLMILSDAPDRSMGRIFESLLVYLTTLSRKFYTQLKCLLAPF